MTVYQSLTKQNSRNGDAEVVHFTITSYHTYFTKRERILLEGGLRILHDPYVYSLIIMANKKPI